ncbi:MAG: hypothetical protein KFW07_01390 [Mycoplasmataceae bacterium]|nr:hypothetical protein [Mycoplasmataceae bacterium]
MWKLNKKIILSTMFVASFVPLAFSVSCNSSTRDTKIKELLKLEVEKKVSLSSNTSFDSTKIHLLDVASNNSQLADIFILPEKQIVAEGTAQYEIFYTWDFTQKNIVSFDEKGHIIFEVVVNAGLLNSNNYLKMTKNFTIGIEETTIIEEDHDLPSAGNPESNKKAFKYIYESIEFRAVRSDVFTKSIAFNIDFYSEKSLIRNRPVIVEPKATNESAIDAYTSKSLIKAPALTSDNENWYRFNIDSADFDELNPKKGIYKIRVSPEIDRVFTRDLIAYANKEYSISFDKYYYYYEKDKVFKYPTENNITTHKRENDREAERITSEISKGSYVFKPTIKKISLIIGKNADEIIEINSSTPGGIFLPPLFYHQYSSDMNKPVTFSITNISSVNLDTLSFEIKVKVGNSSFETDKTVTKQILVNSFFQ